MSGAPASASPDTPERIWEFFVDFCSQALAEPLDTGALETRFGAQGAVGQTEDGWGINGLMTFPGMDTGEDRGFVSANYSVSRFPEGKVSFCTLQVVRPDRGSVSGVVEVADARFTEVLDDAIRHGGEIEVRGQLGLWVSYGEPGLPHDSISIRTADPVTILMLTRFEAEGSE